MSRRLDEAPSKGRESRAFWSVGLVAVIGFGVGVGLPQLAELRLAPRPPTVETDKKSRRDQPARSKGGARSSNLAGRVEGLAAETSVHETPGSPKILGHLPKGTKVLIEAERGEWLLVRHGPEARGWIARAAIAGPGS